MQQICGSGESGYGSLDMLGPLGEQPLAAGQRGHFTNLGKALVEWFEFVILEAGATRSRH